MISEWLNRRYEYIWEVFQEKPFRFEDALSILTEKSHDPKEQINVILSELRKGGMLKVDFDPDDTRRRIYRLKSKKDIIADTLAIENKELTRADLERLLKSAADLIRTRVDYTFILVLLFYKRISDKWELEYEDAYKEATADGFSKQEAKIEAKNSIYHDFDISEELLWESIRKDPARIPENFSLAMKTISEKNPELKAVFENIDFVQFTTSVENAEILRQLVELLSEKSLHHVSPDILGDAYEWILRYFAPQKAKEGEVYTAREVIRLIVEILEPKPDESVYDPACGSGGMLISSYKYIEETHGRTAANRLALFGQEANHKTLALAKMNLYIHDIINGQLSFGDTLLYPKFKDSGTFKKFDVVIANPPWNQDGYDEDTLKKGEFASERYEYGFSPKQSADWVWIEHMLASAKEINGRVGVVIDNGCLFRGGREGSIREKIIDKDLIDSVILLPEKLFYNTGAPGAIIILTKNKDEKKKDKILFINASREFEQHPEVRKLNQLGIKNINRIVKAYKDISEIEGFSKLVDKQKIKENDYNLNVTLYVYPEEEIEDIDISIEWQDLLRIENELKENEKKMESYLKELGEI